MWKTNIKVVLLSLFVIGFYTTIAQIIPQLQSAVPEALELGSDVTPEALAAAGEGVFTGVGGCTVCHGLGTRAPNLRTGHAGEGTIGSRCGGRKSDLDCKAYLYESLTDPGAYLVEGFTNIMPDATRQLGEQEIWAVIAYLQSQGGEITVTASDIQAGDGAGSTTGAAPTGGGGAASFSDVMDPMQLLTVNACIGCHGINGAAIPIGPSFDGIGSRLTAEQIRKGILDPNAEIAEGFDQFAGLMPATFGSSLSAAQLEAIVQFLVARK